MFKPYETHTFYDEMLDGETPRVHYIPFYQRLQRFTENQLLEKHKEAQSSFLRQGITFTVYGAEGGTERTMPFDFVPIVIPEQNWNQIEEGMKQRVEALNLFLHDVYHEQEIVKAGIVPKDLIDNNPYYYKQVIGA